MGRRPRDVHVLVPELWVRSLHGKGGFAHVITFRTLSGGAWATLIKLCEPLEVGAVFPLA